MICDKVDIQVSSKTIIQYIFCGTCVASLLFLSPIYTHYLSCPQLHYTAALANIHCFQIGIGICRMFDHHLHSHLLNSSFLAHLL